MRIFVSTEGQDRLGLVNVWQRFADAQWAPARLAPIDAAANILDAFKRAVAGELELLQVDALEGKA